MRRALAAARERWPGAPVREMPQNNPGFDLLIELPDGDWYVEVKSTAGATPRFFLSEGERAFAERAGDRYSLLVVTDVTAGQPSGIPCWRDGALEGPGVELRPRQWRGELRAGAHQSTAAGT
jgi:hypothetical protein